jgi:hypothetical protein
MKVSHFLRFAAIGTTIVSRVIHAHEIGANFDCRAGPHKFIEQLVEGKEIDPRPMKVSDNAVNVYRVRPNQNFTAFGFRVRAVFGYSRNDDMFIQRRGGAEVPNQVYGVVVMAGKDAVNNRISEAGSPATVREVMPLVMSAVLCEK